MKVNAVSSCSNVGYLQKSFKGGFNRKAYNYVKPLVAGSGFKFTTLCAMSALGITVFDNKISAMRKDFSKNYISNIDKQRNYAAFQFENSLVDGLPTDLLAEGLVLLKGRIKSHEFATINDGKHSPATIEEYLACDEGGSARIEFEYVPKNNLVSEESDLGLELIPPRVQFLADLLTEKGVETKLMSNYKGFRRVEFTENGRRKLIFVEGNDLADRNKLCNILLNKLKNLSSQMYV